MKQRSIARRSTVKFHHRWAAAALFVVASGVSTLSHAASISGQGTWETTLQGRDLDGNLATAEAYYDTALDIPWLANATYAGRATVWATANSWAAGLNPYGSGITGWRLPTTIDADGPDADALGNDGCGWPPSVYQGLDCGYNNTTHSEMSHMFYVTLGDKAFFDTSGLTQPDYGLINTGPFSNFGSGPDYWSATEYAPDTNGAWHFTIHLGVQVADPKTVSYYAWAVHSGDVGAAVAPVQVPAAIWLFGSGLVGLFGLARRRAR